MQPTISVVEALELRCLLADALIDGGGGFHVADADLQRLLALREFTPLCRLTMVRRDGARHFAGAVPRQRMRESPSLTMPTSFFALLSTGSLRMRFSSMMRMASSAFSVSR